MSEREHNYHIIEGVSCDAYHRIISKESGYKFDIVAVSEDGDNYTAMRTYSGELVADFDTKRDLQKWSVYSLYLPKNSISLGHSTALSNVDIIDLILHKRKVRLISEDDKKFISGYDYITKKFPMLKVKHNHLSYPDSAMIRRFKVDCYDKKPHTQLETTFLKEYASHISNLTESELILFYDLDQIKLSNADVGSVLSCPISIMCNTSVKDTVKNIHTALHDEFDLNSMIVHTARLMKLLNVEVNNDLCSKWTIKDIEKLTHENKMKLLTEARKSNDIELQNHILSTRLQ